MSTKVHYSFVTYDYAAHEIVPLAKAAEAAGFNGIWAGEHYVCPQDFTSFHPTEADDAENPAKWIVGANVRLHDPWPLLSAMAGATTKLQIGSAICIVPLNHPLVLARSVLTAQEISGGRLMFGTGVGWLQEEFDALDIPFKTRASRYDEMLDILRQAWSGGYFAHKGRHFSFPAIQISPHEVDVPMIIGGNSEVALRRVAKKGDGWLNSAMIELEDALRLRDRIEDLRKEHGTSNKPFSYHVRPPKAEPGMIDKFVAEGFTNIVLWGPQVWPNDTDAPVDEKTEQLNGVAKDLGLSGA